MGSSARSVGAHGPPALPDSPLQPRGPSKGESLKRRVGEVAPVGATVASWSNVMHSPPAATMRARAVSVNLSAHTFSLGTSYSRTSSVTVPTSTAIFPSALAMNAASLDSELRPTCMSSRKISHREASCVGTEVRGDERGIGRRGWVAGGRAQRRAVDFAHKEALEHDRVELGIRAAREEAIQLHQQLDVDVIALGRRARGLFVAPAGDQVDSLQSYAHAPGFRRPAQPLQQPQTSPTRTHSPASAANPPVVRRHPETPGEGFRMARAEASQLRGAARAATSTILRCVCRRPTLSPSAAAPEPSAVTWSWTPHAARAAPFNPLWRREPMCARSLAIPPAVQRTRRPSPPPPSGSPSGPEPVRRANWWWRLMRVVAVDGLAWLVLGEGGGPVRTILRRLLVKRKIAHKTAGMIDRSPEFSTLGTLQAYRALLCSTCSAVLALSLGPRPLVCFSWCSFGTNSVSELV